MKLPLHVTVTLLLFCTHTINDITDPTKKKIDNLNKSGYYYAVNFSEINSEYSEIACTTFRQKLILISSKKIGALGSGKDPITNRPFMDLFCTEIKAYGKLGNPILFSRIINTRDNEGQVAFSPDEHTIYYTRSLRTNVLNYKLYKAKLEKNSNGNWINETKLSISSDSHSVETPHVSKDGEYLYFSSNMKGGYGGFDLYKSKILEDGTLGEPENLGPTINTSKDEKYPHTSKNSEELFFSSKGHESIGGYDIFLSDIINNTYKTPKNLGHSINSTKDEIAFIYIDDKKGIFSSNKENEDSAFNMYRFQSRELYNELKGIVITRENKIIPHATVILLDSEDNEIERQVTNKDATYRFKLKAYKDYKIKVLKEGYQDFTLEFESKNKEVKAILKLLSN